MIPAWELIKLGLLEKSGSSFETGTVDESDFREVLEFVPIDCVK
jgi:hypothetical protein